MLGSRVIVDGVSGRLVEIDYKNRTALVEMDYETPPVDYQWSKIIIKE